MKRSLFALLGAGILLGGCTTIGTGFGSLGDEPVSFSWKSSYGGITGTMSATLTDGKTFSGPYLQITSEARTENFAPGWGYLGTFPAMVYSDRVMANLTTADGQRMHCDFNLNHQSDGMSGGGRGQCQLQGDGIVEAVFPAS